MRSCIAATTVTPDAASRASSASTSSNPENEKWRTVTAYDGDTTVVIPPMGATPEASITDIRGRVIELVQYVRDPDDDGAADTLAEVLALPHMSTEYTFGQAGQLAEMRDASDNVWSFDYDWGGRQVSASDPDSGTTTTTYDLLDRVVTRTNANDETVAYTYDPLGRVTTLRDDSTTGNVRSEWGYDQSVDADGQPLVGLQTSATRFVDGQAYTSATPTYDDAYRPLTTTFTLPDIAEFSALESRTFTTEYSYAANGQVASVSLPAVISESGATALGAETVTTRYDTASMPSWMSGGFGWGTYVAESRFAADGRPVAADLGNTYGAVVSYGYEEGTNRLTGISLTRQGYDAELALSYGYDSAGNVTSLRDQASAMPALQDNQCFGYDGLRRLEVAWTAGNGDCGVAQSAITPADVGGAEPYWAEYGYDALGNRVSLVDHGVSGSPSTVTTTYQHGAGGASPHQVTSVMSSVEGSPLSDVAFEYDDAGNRVTATSGAETNSYAWDVEGELVADDDYEYVYDASGSRIVRSGADGVTVYLPGGQEVTIEGATVSATRYYSFAGSTVAVRSGKGLGGVTSLVSDRDGSVVAAVPNTVWTASSVERVYADPFGGVRGGSDAGVPGDRRFLGGTLDAESGLTLLGARYYDAALGRFISVDPLLNLGVPSHFNAYSYAYGNPMTFSDPSGLEPAGEKIGLGKNSGGGGGKKPPSTSWAALAACSDFWCQQGWHFSTSVRGALGVVKGLAGLVWEASTVKLVVEDVIPMISDWDGYWAGWNDQLQADVEFWSGPDPVGELGNAIWSSLSGAWQNDPGMLIGEGVAFGGTAVIPGVLPIKVVSAANKVGNAVTTAARACSFTAATVVLMATGELKPIASVVVGDLVVASDPETGEQAAKPVEQVFVHEDVVFDLVIGDEVISTTEDHPFWSVTDERFERADQLELGELVLSAAGATVQVSGIVAGSTRTALAYNLAVEDIHTFHVGNDTILVHNTCDVLVNLASPSRTSHILDGEIRPDGSYGGGHRGGTGFTDKTEFPSDWSDAQIMHQISDVATDPSIPWVPSGPSFVAHGTRGGVDIKVVIRGGQIVTGYPTNVPRNP